MRERVKEIIGEILDVNVNDINDDSLILDELGADSIAVMEIVMELETEYDMEVDTEQIPNLKTVNDIVAYLEKQ